MGLIKGVFKMNTINLLYTFANKRPMLDFRDYGDVSAYRSESRRITQHRNDARVLLRHCELFNIEPDFSAFSGRLSLENGKLEYCTGQYYPTEYRAAVAAVCAKAIWYTWRENTLIPNNVGFYLHNYAKREFGAGIAKRWFN